MLTDYVPILLLFLLALGFTGAILLLSHLLGRRRPNPEKLSPYECGIDPVGDARIRFSVRFYIIAMLFILFDIEVVFLYPWAVVFRELGLLAYAEMAIFLLILLAGYAYAWRKGALDWE